MKSNAHTRRERDNNSRKRSRCKDETSVHMLQVYAHQDTQQKKITKRVYHGRGRNYGLAAPGAVGVVDTEGVAD
jgi:hypothetical protein